MARKRSKDRRVGWASYLASFLFFGALATLFLPVLGVMNEKGIFLSFESKLLFFGGLQTIEMQGSTYSFAFRLNPYFIAIFATIFVSFLLALFGRNSPTRLLLSLIALLVAAVGLAFAPRICLSVNSPMPTGGIFYDYGFYVAEFLFASAAIFLLVLFFRSRSFWRKKKQK